MKKLIILICAAAMLLFCAGCAQEPVQIAATTRPVYDFTAALCKDTGLTVGRLVTENVSCLHDYTLQVSQMQMAEQAEVVVLSGLGLDAFLTDALPEGIPTIDAARGIAPMCADHHAGEIGHDHENDPHIWLSPLRAKTMAQNICRELCQQYPDHSELLKANLAELESQFDALQAYGEDALKDLSCRKMITFHDGFAYFCRDFDLEILKAIEEESGREASALELIALIRLVEEHQLPAVFLEVNGSVSAAGVIARETGCRLFPLDMAMGENDYFTAMYHNIDSIKEALE